MTAGLTLRRAEPDDLPFLVELITHDEVEPFLAAVRPRDQASLLAEIERSQREPEDFGRMIIDLDGRRAGLVGYEVANRRSRIAHLEALALHPDYRGRGIADEAARLLQRFLIFELGFHRLQLEIYGFNARAIQHAERAGFVREGVKRKAYWRHDEWVDGIMFGLVREDLEEGRAMELIHTCYRITDPERSIAFYEALGFEKRRELPIRDEAMNYFLGVPGKPQPELELTHNFGVDSYEIGTAYGHIAVTVEDIQATLARLKQEHGIEPEKPPYSVREGGSLLAFVRDPDDYRVELIERSDY